MRKIIVQYGQSLYDLALQCYGHPGAVVMLISDNPSLTLKITDYPAAGTTLFIRQEVPRISENNQRIAAYYAERQIIVASGMGSATPVEAAASTYADPDYFEINYVSYP